MAVSKDIFPFAPLGEQSISLITAVLGVRSPDDSPMLDGFRVFLASNRETALPEGWYRRYLQNMGRMCLGALDIMDKRATTDCNRGALLYAGAICVASSLRPLPRDGKVLIEKREGNTLDLAITALQAADNIPSFREILKQVSPLFSVDSDYNGLNAARVGAGLLHVITTDSIAVAERDGVPLSVPGVAPTALDGIQMDDGLLALMEMFDNADWPENRE